MTDSKIVFIEGIGEVELRKYRANKYLRLTIKSGGKVLVSLPLRASWQDGIKFVKEKANWLAHHKEKTHKARENLMPLPVTLPPKAELQAAAKILTARTRELANMFGFSFGKISFRNQSTIWGSCSAKNNISLNIHLMFLPPELSDYILLHELVHTKVKNHSELFWHELDKCLGRPGAGKARQKLLRKYRVGQIQ